MLMMYLLVPPCTVQVQGSTYWYVLVCTAIGITYVGTYWYVPFWGFSYGFVSSKVLTGSYQYIPSCTALYLVYRIPDDTSYFQLLVCHIMSPDIIWHNMNRVCWWCVYKCINFMMYIHVWTMYVHVYITACTYHIRTMMHIHVYTFAEMYIHVCIYNYRNVYTCMYIMMSMFFKFNDLNCQCHGIYHVWQLLYYSIVHTLYIHHVVQTCLYTR
jgi:hypothetical protein